MWPRGSNLNFPYTAAHINTHRYDHYSCHTCSNSPDLIELICSSMTDCARSIRVPEFNTGKILSYNKKSPEKLEAESCIRWESVYVKYLRKCKCYIPPLLTICHGIYTYIYLYIFIWVYIQKHTCQLLTLQYRRADQLHSLIYASEWHFSLMFCGCF